MHRSEEQDIGNWSFKALVRLMVLVRVVRGDGVICRVLQDESNSRVPAHCPDYDGGAACAAAKMLLSFWFRPRGKFVHLHLVVGCVGYW